MYEFLDRFVTIALPRVRDFRGLSAKSFDGRGNYACGIKEQLIFPEINYDRVDQIRGMDIIIATSATSDDEARELLRLFNFPFPKEEEEEKQAAARNAFSAKLSEKPSRRPMWLALGTLENIGEHNLNQLGSLANGIGGLYSDGRSTVTDAVSGITDAVQNDYGNGRYVGGTFSIAGDVVDEREVIGRQAAHFADRGDRAGGEALPLGPRGQHLGTGLDQRHRAGERLARLQRAQGPELLRRDLCQML